MTAVKSKKLSRAQLKVLHNLATGQDARAHLVGASQHGGYWQTSLSLMNLRMVKDDEITLLGCIEHRAWCCKRGKKPDDFTVEEVESALLREERITGMERVVALKESRPLYEVAKDIQKNWVKPSLGAVPYIKAMLELTKLSDKYGMDDGKHIVLRLLSNASLFKGPDARRIKEELRDILDEDNTVKRVENALSGRTPGPSTFGKSKFSRGKGGGT